MKFPCACAFCLSFLAACQDPPRAAQPRRAPKAAATEQPGASAAPAQSPVQPWSAAQATPSNAGTYIIRVTPAPASIPQGEVFALEVWVFDANNPEQPAADVLLNVDADMPEHGHGLPRRPSLEQRGPGHFIASGLRLHMPGNWEIYFDIARGALTERAQIALQLE